MANNVYTYVSVQEATEKGMAAWDAIIDRIEKLVEDNKPEEGQYNYYNPNLFELWKDTATMESERKYAEITDAIGSKWAYIEDSYKCDKSPDGMISICSAWGYPSGALERIAKEVQEADPTAIISAVYDDEMPNFFGSLVYADGDWEEEFVDSDDYKDLDIYFWWDEDDGEEPEDFDDRRDEAYDKMNDIRDEDVRVMIASVHEQRAERDE